ncbi:NAD(P)H-dependent oxidoreductase [Streptomyces sp. DSM 44915]|uniref:FMN dependent NADH:quinone oxidoreductase n=1 Tax=Streptomyces chisholmiae TaxID=3075540 RepID=A0ABU2JPP4_9ACTN|nr:NAD(P)H-dependent oxidoreductase [Streptomyces sp. DSM 44915]MDT0266954.1 NAD(P)H-dependent oxidoreductase [Streptomyces sp. DSM 44915]
MATLLHLDSSLNGDNSVSREVTRTFRESWEAQHPEGTVIYRDLTVDPLPHLDAAGHYAPTVPAEQRTAEQRAALAVREELIAEFESADAVVIGAPLYNWGVPTPLLTYLHQIVLIGRTAGETSSVSGKPVTVVTSHGGSYAPGTPRAGQDFSTPYLRQLLGTALQTDVRFILAELTLARVVPAMAELVDQADASRAQAHEAARDLGKELATQLAA